MSDSQIEDFLLPVEGMSCAGCASGLQGGLSKLEGIVDVSVNFALSNAHITASVGAQNQQTLVAAIEAAGYGVPTVTHTFDITGMSCAGCAASIEKSVNLIDGVLQAEVNFAIEKLTVQALQSVSSHDLINAVTKLGYSALVPQISVTQSSADSATPPWYSRLNNHSLLLCVGIVLSLPMVLQMLGMSLGAGAFLPEWVEFLLATPVQFWVGFRFYQGAYRALRSGNGNMDVLVVLGTTAAYLFSVYLLLTASSSQLYFESAAVVITLVMLGRWLELRAKQSATAAIRELMALRPQNARRVIEGEETEVSVSELALGDVVVVRPGEAIPVDGVLQQGLGEVDESLISGESMPVVKQVGDKLTGGSINGNGLLHIEVNALGRDTTLSRIIDIVEKAQTGKAPVQRLVDKISAVFVPVVAVFALVTLMAWMISGAGFEQAIIAAVSVLVIACPCALGLATPTALVAGTGVAAKEGILIKDIATLESASKIKRVVFDKTGTLTAGRPQVTDYISMSRDSVELGYAASLQSASEHPLAKALSAYAKEHAATDYTIETFENLPGRGVVGDVAGRHVVIGNPKFITSQIKEATDYQHHFASLESEGKTAVGIVLDEKLLAVVGFADQIRAESAEAIKALKAKNLITTILSGDAQAVTASVADQLGVDSYEAGLAPEQKASMVSDYTLHGEPVVMVGDGVNDAPALAVADVGIAMGSGTDVAIAASSFTLLRADPRLVAAALDIATATRSKIHQNLFWAFVYNIIGIPLAAFGMLTPSVAGAAMAMSSVSVVVNALLLKRWRPRFAKVD